MDLSLGDDALDVGNGLVEDLLEGLGVLELLANLGNDGVGELLLLTGLDGTLVADPGVEDGLGLVGEVDLLLELVSLGLELGGFLSTACQYRCDIRMFQQSCSTLETAKSCLVMSTTPPRSWTLAMRFWTASVWSLRAALRMFLILLV